jgi:cyclohexanecarboxylate-CoA ligase
VPLRVDRRAARYATPGGPWDQPPLVAPRGPRTAIVDGPWRLDFDALDRHAGALAAGLRRRGACRGGVVAFQLPTSAPAVLLFWAAWRLGAVAAPLHHRFGTTEVAHALDVLDPAVLIALEGLPAACFPGALVLGACDPEALLGAVGEGGSLGRDAIAARGADPALVLFTSGSTGMPKAVVHTRRALSYKARLMARVHGLDASDVVLVPAPLAHVSGALNGVLLPQLAGMTSVLMGSWDPKRAVALVEAERVSFMGAPPVFFAQMLEAGARPGPLRLISTGGASVSPAFVHETARALRCRVKRTYGSTEAPTVATTSPGDPPELAATTEGRAVGVAELAIVEPGGTRRLPPGSQGEILVRGPELFAGYLDEAATREAIVPGGWLRTGDLGSLDEAGYLTVTGRLKDVIIRAGENVAASEVEAVLEAHPSVRRAVAVGIPDPVLGERVAAFVIAPDGFDLEACRRWFSARGVARFKTPELVVCVDDLPTLPTGKPDRRALAAQAEQLAHLIERADVRRGNTGNTAGTPAGNAAGTPAGTTASAGGAQHTELPLRAPGRPARPVA